jgi:lysozyme
MALIVDVSNHNGNVDWKAVLASGRAGGICKATEALGYVDPTFAANWAALKNLNATRGCYCFAQPAKAVPEATADKFLTVVGPTKPGDILVLDLEVGTGDLSAWALTWLDRVKAKTGITPWLYSYGPFIRAHLTSDRRLADYPLWLAAYQTSPPACPPPWTSFVLWQHTNAANVPGITGPCDESVGTPPAITPAEARMAITNPVGAPMPRPGAPAEQFAQMSKDGSMYAFNGAPYCGGYNQHSDWWGGPTPNSVRNGLGFVWDADGWGYTQYFDDGAHYGLRADGH